MNVTFIVPVYNQAKYLPKAIESIASQTFKWHETIIVNDSSPDNAEEVIDGLISKYPSLEIRKMHTENIGPSNARHTGIMNSRCAHYVPLDADDWIEPNYLERMFDTVNKAKDNSSIGFYYCDTVYHTEGSNHKQNIPSPEYSLFQLIQNNFASYCSMFNKHIYLQEKYNLDNFGYLEDYELYLRLGRKGYYGKHIAEPLFNYLVHKDSSFQSERTKKLQIFYRYYIIAKYPEIHPLQWVEEANRELKKMPDGFMKMTPKEQEKLIESL
jgi:glycosyltransferase involved in cell wall biosynthesis